MNDFWYDPMIIGEIPGPGPLGFTEDEDEETDERAD